eukprot:g2295.t1
MDGSALIPSSAESERKERETMTGSSESGAVILLTLTAMGAGILSLPATLYYGGYVTGLAVLAVFAVLSDYSLILLVRCASMTGLSSISAMANKLYGKRGEVMVSVVTLLLLFFAQIAMLIVIGDVLTPPLQYFGTGDVYKTSCDDSDVNSSCKTALWAGTTRCDADCTSPPWYFSRLMVSFVATAIYFPLSLFDELKALSASSTAAVVAILFVIVALCVELGRQGVVSSDDDVSGAHLNAATPSWRVLMIPSVLSCAFCCHFNVLEVREEMRPSSKARIESVIHKSILGLVLLTYVICALVGYLLFGDKLHGCSDILTCFDSTDRLMLVCSIAIGLVNVVKMPLIMIPTRVLILELYAFVCSETTGRCESGDVHDERTSYKSVDENDVERSASFETPTEVSPRSDRVTTSSHTDKMALSSVQRVVLMLSLSLVVLVLAIVMHDLTIGFSVVACSSGMAVCFIIPGALYDAALVAQRLDRGVPISTFDTKRYAPLALVAFGVMMVMVAFVGIVLFILYN